MKDVIIGSAVARNGLFLAPMAGFTDAPFRALCRLYGATYTVSEMISAAAMHFGDRKTASLARLPDGDTPTALQPCVVTAMPRRHHLLCSPGIIPAVSTRKSHVRSISTWAAPSRKSFRPGTDRH